MYIYDNVVILSSMWYVLKFEYAHGIKRYNDRGMTRGQTTCSLGGIASLGLLLPYFILIIFIAVFPKTNAPSKSSVKAVAIFLFLAIKLTPFTVPCNEYVPRLLLQQLSVPNRVNVTDILSPKDTGVFTDHSVIIFQFNAFIKPHQKP